MKSRMKCFSILALIAFGFGYTDLLVRPCWAHNNGSRSHLLLHGVDHAVHDAINDARDAVDAAVDAAVEELNEWVDSGGEVIHFVSSFSFSSGNSGNSGISNVDYSDPPNNPTWSCALCGADLNYMTAQSHDCSQHIPPGGNSDVSPELENNPKVEDDEDD
ncbi:MAG: hypothetical protein F4Z85_13075 [Gemmatimonadetes bacterium]|nr:hypothetical protein [Gemmatimonadota bacterium]MYB71857.1 hypothetical protein [Gemmatimonadota bacterium]